MKALHLSASLLLLTACIPADLPGRSGHSASPAVVAQPREAELRIQETFAVSGRIENGIARFEISPRVQDPADRAFATTALSLGDYTHFRLEVLDSRGKVYRPAGTDAHGLLPLGPGASVNVSRLPQDEPLRVKVTPFNAQLPAASGSCAAIEAVFALREQATIAVSYRTTPTAEIFWALHQKRPGRLEIADLPRLQAFVDELIGYREPEIVPAGKGPKGRYRIHPSLVNSQVIAEWLLQISLTELMKGHFDHRQIFEPGARLRVLVSGLASEDQARLRLSDPASQILTDLENGGNHLGPVKIAGCSSWRLSLESAYALDPAQPNPVTIDFSAPEQIHELTVRYLSSAAPVISGVLVNGAAPAGIYRAIDEIRLSGSNFLSATSLTIQETGGGTHTLSRGSYGSSSFEVVNDTSIRFRLPPEFSDRSPASSEDVSFVVRNSFAGGSDSAPSPSFNVIENILVDDSSQLGGDGASWATAYRDLQQGLAAAEAGDEIWIAAGSYTPGRDRGDSFRLKPQVAVYGGFSGSEGADEAESALGGSERNTRSGRAVRPLFDPQAPDSARSILSGDSDGNDSYDRQPDDGLIHTGTSSNSYHVVTGADDASLDGVTIQGGNAGDAPLTRGGGLLNEGTSPRLSRISFRYNTATHGGGLANLNAYASSDSSLSDLFFESNLALNAGGGMYNAFSRPVLLRGGFSDNLSSIDGGGIKNEYSNPSLTELSFSRNRAQWGGGLYEYNSASSLSKLRFEANVATHKGGGTYLDSSSPNLSDVDFVQNHAGSGGGLMSLYGSPRLIRVNFLANRSTATNSEDGGGGMYSAQGNPELEAVRFEDNLASRHGGGIYNLNGSPSLKGVSFTRNGADPGGSAVDNLGYGGGMYSSDSAPNAAPVTAPVLEDASFSANQAEMGGGIYNNYSHPVLSSASFEDNYASRHGAGIYNLHSNPSLSQASFSRNAADRHGGGMHNRDSSPVLTEVSFVANRADANSDTNGNGGGIYSIDSNPAWNRSFEPRLTRVSLYDNQAYDGGGLYSEDVSLMLRDVAVWANRAARHGGGSAQLRDGLQLTNAVFAGNSAGSLGGGLYLNQVQSELRHASFSQNTAASGGGLWATHPAMLTLYNSLFWQSPAQGPGPADLALTQGNLSAEAATDPFVASGDPSGSDGNFFSADDGLRLSDTATALLDLGQPVTGADEDITGRARSSSAPEPGAYEGAYPRGQN